MRTNPYGIGARQPAFPVLAQPGVIQWTEDRAFTGSAKISAAAEAQRRTNALSFDPTPAATFAKRQKLLRGSL